MLGAERAAYPERGSKHQQHSSSTRREECPVLKLKKKWKTLLLPVLVLALFVFVADYVAAASCAAACCAGIAVATAVISAAAVARLPSLLVRSFFVFVNMSSLCYYSLFPHIPTHPLKFGGVSGRILSTSNTNKTES